jgi:UDP-3-O-[3-hydroxymyristoyl] glucosamine N-acyltransferase
VVITAQSGTHGDIPAGSMVSGSPAFEHKQWLRAVNAFSKLPDLARTVRNLARNQVTAKSEKKEE